MSSRRRGTVTVTDKSSVHIAASEVDLPSLESAVMEELAHLAQRVGAAHDLLSVLRALRMYTTSLVGNNALFVSLLSADRSQFRPIA